MICSRCRLFVPLWFLYFNLNCLINYSANFSAFILSLSTCLSLVFKGNVHRCPVSLAPRLAYLLAQTEYQLSTWELSFLHSPLNDCRVFLLPVVMQSLGSMLFLEAPKQHYRNSSQLHVSSLFLASAIWKFHWPVVSISAYNKTWKTSIVSFTVVCCSCCIYSVVLWI